MKRILPSVLICAPLLALAQPAAPPPAGEPAILTEEQTASIMKQLDLIEAQITKTRSESLAGALVRFKAGAASEKDALDLYLACYKLDNFDRKDRKVTEFQEWRDQNEERLKESEFMTAQKLQLEYLVLSIQAQDVKETKDLGPLVTALQGFIPRATATIIDSMKRSASGLVEEKSRAGGGGNGRSPGAGGRPPGGGGGPGGRQGLGGPGIGNSQILATLSTPVKGSVYTRAYLLDEFLTKEEWDYSPLNVPGIYQTVIFPYYLEQKPAELPAQWDARINAELTLRKAVLSESEYQIYYKDNYPLLLWARASFLLQNNITPVMAMADMLKVVRDNPTHPRAGAWVEQLRKAVVRTQPSAGPSALDAPAAPGT